jgi:NADH-quinone oxidoreductase subunit J
MATVVGTVAFSYLAALSIASAVLAVTRRNPVHSMLWVLALFLHIAGIFLLTGAEFLAAVQVVVYAGAILVFYLFFQMLLDLPQEIAGPRFGAHWPLCTAAGIAFAAIAWFMRDPSLAPLSAAPLSAAPLAGGSPGSLSAVGTVLFTRFALPFEIASLILLAAIVGAVVLARKRSGA